MACSLVFDAVESVAHTFLDLGIPWEVRIPDSSADAEVEASFAQCTYFEAVEIQSGSYTSLVPEAGSAKAKDSSHWPNNDVPVNRCQGLPAYCLRFPPVF
jgi:hypothetical protein